MERKIKEYKVITGSAEDKFSQDVTAALAAGYELVGSPSAAFGKINTMPGTLNNRFAEGYLFMQAVIIFQ